MANELLEQYQTGFFPHRVTWTRLWKRHIHKNPTYTVAIENNCIVGNYPTYKEAKAKFDSLQRQRLAEKHGYATGA